REVELDRRAARCLERPCLRQPGGQGRHGDTRVGPRGLPSGGRLSMSVTPTSIPPSDHLGLTTRFLVTIDGFRLGGVARCDGPAGQFDLYTYKPLGHNDYVPVLPNRLIYPNITLTRAITKESAPTVIEWLSKMAGKGAGATAEITLLDAHRDKVT